MTRSYTRRKPLQQEGEISDQPVVSGVDTTVSASTTTKSPAQVDMRMFLDLQQQTLELQRIQADAFLRQSQSLEIQTERTAPKDNPHYVPNSYSINPETGETWASSLKCDVYDGPSLLNRTALTEEEVRQANRLEPVDKGYLIKGDRSRVPAHVSARYNAQGAVDRLTIHRPIGPDDNAQVYPSLDEICRQLADQAVPLSAE
jgi:hypothetical protein